MISLLDALEYEIKSSWWAKYISNNQLQELTASYFGWKTKRKFWRYQMTIAVGELIKNVQQKEVKL